MDKSNGFLRWINLLLSHQAYRIGLLVMVLLRSCWLLSPYVGPLVKVTLIWSAAILVKDLFQERLLLTNRYRGFFYIFLFLYGLTALVMRGSNFSRNVASFAYLTTNLMVIYAYDLKDNREKVKRQLRQLCHVFITITFVGGVITLLAFFLNIHYQYIYESGGEVTKYWFGFYSGRMWGFFTNPNSSGDMAVINLMMVTFCTVISGGKPSQRARGFYIADIVVQLLIFFLANSRTAWICMALYLVTLPFFFLMFRKKGDEEEKPRTKWEIFKRAAAIGLAAAFCCAGMSNFSKSILPKLVLNTRYFSERLAQLPDSEIPDEDEDPEEFEVPENLDRSDFGTQLGGRYYLWQAGFKIVGHHPLLGVGLANLEDYAVKYSLSPEMANVDPESEEYVKPYLPGIGSGGMHNMPLQIAACSGLTGLAVFAAFAGCYIFRVVRYLIYSIKRKKTEPAAALLASMMMVMLCRSMTEIGLLYSVYYTSVVFWTFAAGLMYFVEKDVRGDPGFPHNGEPVLARLTQKIFRSRRKQA